MARNKEKTLEEYIQENKEKLVNLCLYRPEFDYQIRVYSHTQLQYDRAWRRLKRQNYRETIETNAGTRKDPLITVIEDLRKQLNVQAQSLGLTPKALDSMKNAQNEPVKTGLEKTLEGIISKIG